MRALIVDPGGFSLPYDLSLVEALKGVGVDVRLLTPEHHLRVWQDPDAMPAGFDGHRERLAGAIAKRAAYLRVLQSVCVATKEWKPEVVHFQWLPFPFVEYQLLKIISHHCGLIFTMHNVGSSHEPRGGLRSVRRREAYSLFDRIIVHSHYSKKEALSQGVAAEDKIRVIQHGALTHYRGLAHRVKRSSSGTVKLLFIGSIKPYKGLENLIEAVALLDQLGTRNAWELCIAGQPSYDISRLQQKVEKSAMAGRVKWILRHLTEREYSNLLFESDIVVLPYTGIDQSGVLMAAIGLGRPVVVTKVGAFPELLTDGKHGLLVNPADPVALGMAIHKLIDSPNQRGEMSNNLSQLASTTLSWSSVAKATQALYKETL